MTEVVTQPDVLGSLGINGKLFLAQLINVGIVLFVVWRWVYRPLLKVMDTRAKKITDGLDHAAQAKQWLAEAETKKTDMIREAMHEAQALINEAQATAETKRQEVLQETQADLERQLQEARARLKQDKEALLQAAKGELVTLIAAATERVAGEIMEEKGQKSSIERALRALERDL